MKIAGIVFIVVSAGSVGFGISSALRKQCALFRKLLLSLQLLRNEIAFCGTPLPQAFALMAVTVDGPLEQVFSMAAREMDKRCWVTPRDAVRKALKEKREPGLPSEAADILLELSSQLGKYDLEAQIRGIDMAKERTELQLGKLEQERCSKSKTYETLGICAGLAVAILLI